MQSSIISWLSMVLLAAPTALTAQDVPVAEGATVSPVSRTSLFVRDLDESLKLYRDILGLKPRHEDVHEGPWWNELMGSPGEDKRLQLVLLQTTEGEVIGNVGLFQFIDENDGPPLHKAPRFQAGDVALIMYTEVILDIYAKVKAAGYTIISPPKTEDSNPGPGSHYQMCFFDRDGFVVYLISTT